MWWVQKKGQPGVMSICLAGFMWFVRWLCTPAPAAGVHGVRAVVVHICTAAVLRVFCDVVVHLYSSSSTSSSGS